LEEPLPYDSERMPSRLGLVITQIATQPLKRVDGIDHKKFTIIKQGRELASFFMLDK
jgi:hypothetical protein